MLTTFEKSISSTSVRKTAFEPTFILVAKLTKNDNADFLVGSIVSTTGDVDLTAKGKFVDALDKVRDNADTQESDLVKLWIDMGLIADTATEQFAEYKTLLESYQSKVADYNGLEDKTNTTAPEMKLLSGIRSAIVNKQFWRRACQ